MRRMTGSSCGWRCSADIFRDARELIPDRRRLSFLTNRATLPCTPSPAKVRIDFDDFDRTNIAPYCR
jgi:hypothetical protein